MANYKLYVSDTYAIITYFINDKLYQYKIKAQYQPPVCGGIQITHPVYIGQCLYTDDGSLAETGIHHRMYTRKEE